jgi:hypothetical protein
MAVNLGLGVELVVTAGSAEACVTPAWASLIRREGPCNKLHRTTTTIRICEDLRDKQRLRAARIPSRGAECSSGFDVIDVPPLLRSIDPQFTRPNHPVRTNRR